MTERHISKRNMAAIWGRPPVWPLLFLRSTAPPER